MLPADTMRVLIESARCRVGYSIDSRMKSRLAIS
jgi:hypothetical protein